MAAGLCSEDASGLPIWVRHTEFKIHKAAWDQLPLSPSPPEKDEGIVME